MIHGGGLCPTKITAVTPYLAAPLNMIACCVLYSFRACLLGASAMRRSLFYFRMILAIGPNGFSHLFCVFGIVLSTISRAFLGIFLSILAMIFQLIGMGRLVIFSRLSLTPTLCDGIRGISLSVIIPLALLAPISTTIRPTVMAMELI